MCSFVTVMVVAMMLCIKIMLNIKEKEYQGRYKYENNRILKFKIHKIHFIY